MVNKFWKYSWMTYNIVMSRYFNQHPTKDLEVNPDRNPRKILTMMLKKLTLTFCLFVTLVVLTRYGKRVDNGREDQVRSPLQIILVKGHELRENPEEGS